MSKIEADKFELSPEEFDFSRMVYRVTDVIGFRTNEKNQRLEVSINPAIPASLVCDEQRLAQVITNLLSNAVKFTPEGGRIAVEAKLISRNESECELEIRVTDSGIGITPEQQAKIFNSFEQADNSISRKFGGTGLGLAISKRIVMMMRGNIRVESKIGEGSSFIFTLWAGIGTGSRVEADAAGQKAPQKPLEGRFAGYRILLAEDVDINREIVKTILEPTGVLIDEAENGRIALEQFTANPSDYDLILMDIQMPGMGGYESTRLIREFETKHKKKMEFASQTPAQLSGFPEGIPIIAMTANVFKEDIEQCIAAGMNDHIGKPLDFDALLALLEKYLPKR
jgi:CheY-like chemotaxis protein